MDAVIREHARALCGHTRKVTAAIEAVRLARAEEGSIIDDGEERGRARARREFAELSEYQALRDYFTVAESLREAIAAANPD